MEGTPLYRLRGQLLPLILLDRMLCPRSSTDSQTALTNDQRSLQDNFIAVLEVDGRRFGLVVDGLADPEEIVVKPLGAVLKSIGLYSGATVLGSGDLALILDPGSIASRAGVALKAQEDQGDRIHDEEQESEVTGSQFLVVEAGQRQAAIPLADVQRIERITLSRIEYIGYRPVLNFGGQLLPIEDAGGALANAADAEAPITVVVCNDSSRQVGIVVTQVLDVASGSDLFEAGSSSHTSGVTLLNNRVTNIVDFGSVQALPVAVQHPLTHDSEWSTATEEVRA
jgi:two-component system chemotaxis sensor kinase CheA